MDPGWFGDAMWMSLWLGVAGAMCGREEAADEWAKRRAALVDELRAQGIDDERVLQAIAAVPRHDFVRLGERERAYVNHALPIDAGQTISQPYVVAFMSQALALRGDEAVLEVGTGSGYQAAVLSHLAARVYSIEIDAGLAASAAERLHGLGYANVQTRAGDGYFGWPEAAPFDAILITAATPRVPPPLVGQLRPGGRLVLPLGTGDEQTVVVATREGDELKVRGLLPVLFVPMTGAVRAPRQE